MTLITACTVLCLLILLAAASRYTVKVGVPCGFEDRWQFTVSKGFIIAFSAVLIATSALRYGFIDTYAYRIMYTSVAEDISYVHNNTWGIEAGWLYFLRFLNFFSHNPQLMLLVCAAVITAAFVGVAKRYSADVCFSLLLYFCLTYMNTNNGLRQYTAAAITILAFPLLARPGFKRILLYVLLVLCAYQLHNSALVCLVIMVIVSGKPLNIRVLIAIALGAVFLVLPGDVNAYIAELFSQSKYLYYLEYTTGMGFMRAFITGILPGTLALSYYIKRRRGLRGIEYSEGVLLNITFINTVFVLMGLVMQYWARFAFYTEFAPIVLMPKLIYEFVGKKHYQIAAGVAVICYIFFFCYNIYVNMGYGAIDSFSADWTWLKNLWEAVKLW